ncbi:MAG: ribonuclease III [Chitinispirillales bacterium]|jgi:ribonuclease-3|nr:ribonuclease III [Chitinispirillales bacterium]
MSFVRQNNKILSFVSGFFFRGKKSVGQLNKFQKLIGYCFKTESLLKHSLTHKSFVSQEDTKGLLSNERLEFLGDSVINCLVTEYLYFTHPDKSEGQLSKIKSLVVSRKILGEIANGLELGKFLIMGPSEEKSGGRSRMSTMSNAFEAVVGAVYLDGGLVPCKTLLERWLFGRIEGFLGDESNINYKSKILEMAQRDGFGIPRYVTVSESGPDHAKQFKVKIIIGGVEMGEGTGPNKKLSQQTAAQNASMNYDRELILSRIKGEQEDELLSQ